MNTTTHRSAAAIARIPEIFRIVAAVLSLLLFGGTVAHAQPADVDPPGRVARLSEVSGQVWLYGSDADEWIGVARNRPLTTGDRIATDNGARAEITLGTTTLRLDAASELEVVRLDDARFVVRLHQGSAAVRLRSSGAAAEFELDTDEGRFRARSAGRYRFDRLEQASDLTVWGGQAVFEGRNSALPVSAGQHAQFWLDAAGAPQYTMVQPVRDGFASWIDERDRAENRAVAPVRYVSPEMTGAEDLDRYGQWEQTPDYGPIWTPSVVPAGWAPYGAGHWAFVRPWGWTWVDDAPWGFAPFHYGRWVNYRERWCWAPGTYVARPVYAPALVAWVGGPRVSVSLSIGRGGPPVGWFPLAPREVYVPSYSSSPTYVRNVNITHVTNITQITTIVNNRNGEGDRRDFVNRRFPGAVTVVPASVVASREAVGPSAAQFRDNPQVRALVAEARPGAAMTQAPVAAPVVPTRPPESRGFARPPFEGRPPGSFAGRGDPGRPDNGRSEGRGDGGRRDGGRIGDPRPGDRPNAPNPPNAPALAGAAPPPPLAGPTTPPGLAGGPAGVRPSSPPPLPAAAPTAPGQRDVGAVPQTAPPVMVPRPPIAGLEANGIGRPPRGGVGREPAAVDAPSPPQQMVPPNPRLRGEAQFGEGRPGGRPIGATPPQSVNPRAEAPRAAEPMRSVEPQRLPSPVPPARVAPDVQRVVPMQSVPRNPEPRAAEAPRAVEPARPPEAQRPPPVDPRAARGDQRPHEERRDERRDDRRDDRREPDKR